jgi:hypothetical protein
VPHRSGSQAAAMARTDGATVGRTWMSTNTLVLLVAAGAAGLIVAAAVAGGLVLSVRRAAHRRAEAELWPAPSVSVPAPNVSAPPPAVPPLAPPAPGAPPASALDLPVLASQPEVPGGWSSIVRDHAAGQPLPLDGVVTPDAVDELDPAELAEAAAAAEGESETGAGEPEPVETLAPVRETRSELVGAASPDPSRLRLLGLVLGLLTERTRQEQPPQLGTALARLGDGDQERARSQLSTLSLTLMGEDQLDEQGEQQLSEFLGDVLGGEMANGFGFSTMPEFQQALNAVTPELRHRLDTVVWSRNADAINILTAEDVEVLERVAVAMTAAMILDTTYGGRPPDDDGSPGEDDGQIGGGSAGEPDAAPHDSAQSESESQSPNE